MKKFWDERYGGAAYVYGMEPNQWFKEKIDTLAPGRALFPADGEGRNSVYAATLGWRAEAFDYSESGQRKALQLAREKGVNVSYRLADAADVPIPPETYDAVFLIYSHFPPEIREVLFPRLQKALKPGGVLLAEVFSVHQLGRNSGGPQSEVLLYTTEYMRKAFASLNIDYLEEKEITLNEGPHHEGAAMVIRMIARRQQ